MLLRYWNILLAINNEIMEQKIFIIWASWNVWRELIRQITQKDTNKYHINPSKIIWITNSKKYIFNSSWIDAKILDKVSEWKDDSNNIFEKEWKDFNDLLFLLELVEKQWLNWEVVFVDVTAWKRELLDFHKKLILDTQNFLVTANKNPISLFSMEEFKILNSYKWRYDTNTTVMWWAWILNFVDERTHKIRDNIIKIQWMFSWTLWYILSELENPEKTFSQIVKEAKEKWYTEPNPWDDLNWLDVARKLIILARYAWEEINIEDIEIKPLIDSKYSKYEWNDFLNAIKNEDKIFEEKVKELKKNNEVLRYVWEMIRENWKIKLNVWIKSVPKNSDLWNISWTTNIAVVETDILKEPLPHIIKSRWAWLEVTAWSVRIWISKMLPNYIKSF